MIDTLHDMNVCKMFSTDTRGLYPGSSIGTWGCSSTLVIDAGGRGRTSSHQTHPNLYFQLHFYQWKPSHYTNLGNQNTSQDKPFLFLTSCFLLLFFCFFFLLFFFFNVKECLLSVSGESIVLLNSHWCSGKENESHSKWMYTQRVSEHTQHTLT